jgi:hypothetical protein
MMLLRSRYAAIAVAAWAAAAAVIALGSSGEVRASLLAGWVLAGCTGGLSFGLLALADGRNFKVFLSSVFGGFLARLVLVSLGLVWAIHNGFSAAWLCVSFFALYWVFLACEYLMLRRMTGGAAQ